MVAITAGSVAHDARLAGARRGPGLLHRGGDPARRRLAGAHRQGGRSRWSSAIKREPVHRERRGLHRLRLHRRHLPQQRGHDLRHAEALGRAPGARAARWSASST